MREERGNDFGSLAIVLILLLLVGGGGAFVWMRRNASVLAAEAAMRRAEAQRVMTMQAAEEAALMQVAAEQRARSAEATLEAAELVSTQTKADEDAEVAAIKQVLMTQQDAWNSGDIDGFMEGYWKSDELTFSSGGETTRSWQSTIDRYKKKYATREAMGTLEFSELEVHLLGGEAAYVLGRWNLKDIAGGNFTLVMRKWDDGWLVIHDHTSVLEESKKNGAE
ncbi:MAG: DUF4440 domain-containing protein [Planctomycetota bacterium]